MAKQYVQMSSDLLSQIAALSSLTIAERLASNQLEGYDFGGLNLFYQKLLGLNLAGAKFVSANLKESKLVASNLVGADFTDAEMDGANLSGTNLAGAILRPVIANGQGFVAVWLRTVDLTGADLQGFVFRPDYHWNLILNEADLRGADLSRIDIMEQRFTTTGAIYNGNTKFPNNFVPRSQAMLWRD